MMQTEMDIPSKADMLANLIEKTGTTSWSAPARPMNFRVPEDMLAEVDAMSEMASKSRNSMMVYLVEVGIEEVRHMLDEDTIYTLNKGTSVRIAQFWADATDRVEFVDKE